MQIPRRNQRDVGPDHLAHAPAQVAFDVLVRLGGAGAVEGEGDSIDGHGVAQPRQQLVAHVLVRLVRDGA